MNTIGVLEKSASYQRADNSARILTVIETTNSTRGKGTDDDPVRVLTQYWTLDGTLLCEVDPILFANVPHHLPRKAGGFDADGKGAA